MRKTFMGVRLRTLREQRGLTQAQLARSLGLSPSYVNQLENNQRPLTVAVLLRLQSALGVDLQWFSEDAEARLVADLQDAVAGAAVPEAEVRAAAQQLPGVARLLVALHGQAREARERLALVASQSGDRLFGASLANAEPHEEVRNHFHACGNHFADLDAAGEALATRLGGQGREVALDLAHDLSRHLRLVHGIEVRTVADEGAANGAAQGAALRRYDVARRVLWLAPTLSSGQRAFQVATQLATLEAGEPITRHVAAAGFGTAEARALARIGLANYFAGAVVLPYGRFLAAAEALAYDIDLLAQRFDVSVETVCHRLSTLQRPGACGVPFFFVRVDQAGNISKRQSATDFHFSRTGGTCPLWNVYDAFAQPERVLVQVAAMPDGRAYLWIARSVVRATGGWRQAGRRFALGLGCDLRHAHRLVYARGLALDDPASATPIGPGCKVCERRGCAQRAFPALGRALHLDENVRLREPYAMTDSRHAPLPAHGTAEPRGGRR